MPSPPSTRPSDARGRRSSAFVRDDLGRASGSALLVDHHCRFGSWRLSRSSFAYVIWLVSRVINVETKIAEELGAKLVEIANKRKSISALMSAFRVQPRSGSMSHRVSLLPAHWRGSPRRARRPAVHLKVSH